MPTCKQLEESIFSSDEKEQKQLTVVQTTKTRFVTKVISKITFREKNQLIFKLQCRFIIETVNGKLKRLKALDNVRNSVINHIQKDYRNACAMINFFHKPCCPDGENSRSIAKRMKKKAKEYENELEYLLKTRLDTKATKELKFSEIEDFPRLSKTIIIENIIFGTYQYNQCQSYYEDLLDNETCYLISEKSYESRNNAENTKIIAFEIASRHKRSEVKKFTKKKKSLNCKKHFKNTYKVFIKYVPLLNEWRSIKSKYFSLKCYF